MQKIIFFAVILISFDGYDLQNKKKKSFEDFFLKKQIN